MIRIALGLGIVYLFACLPILADEPKTAAGSEKATASIWMEQKMKLSRQIMEGLARGKLADVDTSARAMRTLSRIEGWARRSDTKEYRRQLKYFNQATEEIIRQAQKDNLDGATLAFTQMTLSCVACHQELRDN